MAGKNLRDERDEDRSFYLVIAIWPQKSKKLGQSSRELVMNELSLPYGYGEKIQFSHSLNN